MINLFLMVSSLCVLSCAYVALPQDPSQAKDQFECTNKCAALGMQAVFRGGACGCEKK